MQITPLATRIQSAGKCQLRPMVEEDLPRTFAWRMDRETRDAFFTVPKSYADHEAWFHRHVESECLWIIEPGPSSGLRQLTQLGQVSLYKIKDGHAEFGRFIIDPFFRNRGFAKETCEHVVGHAFYKMHLSEITLELRIGNLAALIVYLKVGFKIESLNDGIIFMRIKNR